MKQTLATVLGFFLASLFPAAYLATVYPLSGERNLPSVLGSFVVYYYFIFVATIIFGIPIFLILNKFKMVTWWSAIGCGAFIGFISLLAVTFGGGNNFDVLLMNALLGGCAGFIFWLFWRAGCT